MEYPGMVTADERVERLGITLLRCRGQTTIFAGIGCMVVSC